MSLSNQQCHTNSFFCLSFFFTVSPASFLSLFFFFFFSDQLYHLFLFLSFFFKPTPSPTIFFFILPSFFFLSLLLLSFSFFFFFFQTHSTIFFKPKLSQTQKHMGTNQTQTQTQKHKPTTMALNLSVTFETRFVSTIGLILDNSAKFEDWFLNALNGSGLLNRGFTNPFSMNCLLGLDDDGVVGGMGADFWLMGLVSFWVL